MIGAHKVTNLGDVLRPGQNGRECPDSRRWKGRGPFLPQGPIFKLPMTADAAGPPALCVLRGDGDTRGVSPDPPECRRERGDWKRSPCRSSVKTVNHGLPWWRLGRGEENVRRGVQSRRQVRGGRTVVRSRRIRAQLDSAPTSRGYRRFALWLPPVASREGLQGHSGSRAWSSLPRKAGRVACASNRGPGSTTRLFLFG